MENMISNQIADSPVINKNDCFVRAFAKFTTMPYEKAYSMIKPYQTKTGGIRKRPCKDFLYSQALNWNLASGTLKRFIEEHKIGRFIVFLNNHATVLINGVLHDSGLQNLNKRVKAYVNAKESDYANSYKI